MNVDETNVNNPPMWANLLGYAGLIPFVVLAAAFWWPDRVAHSFISHALSNYAAVIISFLGAIHWGLAMRDTQPSTTGASVWIWGITPSLLAWMATLLTSPFDLLFMAILLWICYRVDQKRYPHHQLESWLPMRFRLTLVASIACLTGSVGFYSS
jgi:hypothetical protein